MEIQQNPMSLTKDESEAQRLRVHEDMLGFFSQLSISQKSLDRIIREELDLRPYDSCRINNTDWILNRLGLRQRRHHTIHKVSTTEMVIPMELTENVMEMQLIHFQEIWEKLSRHKREIATTLS